MAGIVTRIIPGNTPSVRAAQDPAWIRWGLTAAAMLFLGLFLFVPLAAVFTEGLRRGVTVYLAAFQTPDAASAIRLTLLVAAISVPLNLVFGLALAGTSAASIAG